MLVLLIWKLKKETHCETDAKELFYSPYVFSSRKFWLLTEVFNSFWINFYEHWKIRVYSHSFAHRYTLFLTPFIEETILSPLCSQASWQRLFNHVCVSLFLVSLFCSIGPCLFLCQYMVLFTIVFCGIVQNQEMCCLQLYSSLFFGFWDLLWFHVILGLFFGWKILIF